MEDDPVNPGTDLMIARRTLRSEDWWIDQTKNCIVPKPGRAKEGICYGNDAGAPSGDSTNLVNHDFTQDCGFGLNASDLPIGVCPHFVSICIRQ